MKNLQRVRTRRQLLRVTAVGAATFPFLALARRAKLADQEATVKAATVKAATVKAATVKQHGQSSSQGGSMFFEGYEDFDSFGRSSSAGAANRR